MWIRSPALLHIKMKVLIFQTSWKEPLVVMKTYGETFASKVLQMCSIWSTSVNKNLIHRSCRMHMWGFEKNLMLPALKTKHKCMYTQFYTVIKSSVIFLDLSRAGRRKSGSKPQVGMQGDPCVSGDLFTSIVSKRARCTCSLRHLYPQKGFQMVE